MHDELWAHTHDPDDERIAQLSVVQNNPDHDYYHYENIELITVGIDIGSSTSHLMFSRIHLQREQTAHSSRYVVVDRETLYRSTILLTPYMADYSINTEQLQSFVNGAYAAAGYTPADIDSGAIILPGEAVNRSNAHAIADIFAASAGKFVCASAGHNLESILAANGSGAVALSARTRTTVLNVDIGGGTTKFALVNAGTIVRTAAINVGGRLIATNPQQRLTRIEQAAQTVAESIGVQLVRGQALSETDRSSIADALAACVVEVMVGEISSPLRTQLMLTSDLALSDPIDAIVFSGGVSEYIYGNETTDFGDLAIALARSVAEKVTEKGMATPVQQATERIRATVIGASQFTVQLSGNTLSISDPDLLPFRNVPVLLSKLPEERDFDSTEVADLIKNSFTRMDLVEGEDTVALAFEWDGLPRYAQLRNIAEGVRLAAPKSISAGFPLILVFTGDFGKLVGDAMKLDMGLPNPIISIDNLELQEFDYIDIGDMIYPARVVPVVVKSLVFPEITVSDAQVIEESSSRPFE